MKLYIPTVGRAGRLETLRPFIGGMVPKQSVALVVGHDDKAGYPANFEILRTPKGLSGIGPTRQWIVDNHDVHKYGGKMCMLDDDLRFAKRRTDDPSKFTDMSALDFADMFRCISETLETYAHVGVCAREGGNRNHHNMLSTRMLRVLAHDVRVLKKEGIRYDELPVMEDFNVCLRLLRAGYPNIVLAAWTQDNVGGSNSSGGCSTYRTMELQAQGAQMLYERHPNFVKLVQKTTKTAWGGGTRTDVQVQWKNAYRSSIK